MVTRENHISINPLEDSTPHIQKLITSGKEIGSLSTESPKKG